MANYRAFDTVDKCMLYDLRKSSDRIYIGRVEGTEQWVKRALSQIELQRAVGVHDVALTPIYEDDVLRSQNGRRYRVVYQNSSSSWMLYALDDRSYFPFGEGEDYQIIGHKFGKMTALEERCALPFPAKIPDPEESVDALVSFDARTRMAISNNPLANHSLTRAEAVEIPSFVAQRKVAGKGYA